MMITICNSFPRWKQPRRVNGILERYILYISNHMHDFTIWDVVYNSTEPFQDHVLQYLLPGTKYLMKLGVSSFYFYHFLCPQPVPCCFSFLCPIFSPSLKENKTKQKKLTKNQKPHVLLFTLKIHFES